MALSMKYYIGVDVGSGSVRAGLFTESGELVQVSTKDIKINNPESGFYEQSSVDIWNSVVLTVKEITKSVDKSSIKGLSFCATCSLVALDTNGNSVSINTSGDPTWDIIMWMDHRAEKEADHINSKSHKVLDYVGGKISLEMQTPKLLWLKKNLPQSYSKTGNFFDLGDFLRWKATQSLKRSICSVVCKWTHINSPEKNYWDETYFKSVGLEDAIPKIGNSFSFPGDSDRINELAATQLGLGTYINVGFSMIDAHSGVLGMIGCKVKDQIPPSDGQGRLALICGTSNCHMALSKDACNVPGIWGPYYGVILKNSYLSEGGQSAAGKLLDHVVMSHKAYSGMLKEIGSHGKVLSKLEELLFLIGGKVSQLTKDIQVWPDFHGNRSPLADPTLKGMICGLTLADDRDSLALIYLATIQALAYGSRLIKDSMEKCGHNFRELVICGGLTKSNLFLQMHADILGLLVIVPECSEPVLLGAAMSAQASDTKNVNSAVQKMAGMASIIHPNVEDKRYHDLKYEVFLEMVKDQQKYRRILETVDC